MQCVNGRVGGRRALRRKTGKRLLRRGARFKFRARTANLQRAELGATFRPRPTASGRIPAATRKRHRRADGRAPNTVQLRRGRIARSSTIWIPQAPRACAQPRMFPAAASFQRLGGSRTCFLRSVQGQWAAIPMFIGPERAVHSFGRARDWSTHFGDDKRRRASPNPSGAKHQPPRRPGPSSRHLRRGLEPLRAAASIKPGPARVRPRSFGPLNKRNGKRGRDGVRETAHYYTAIKPRMRAAATEYKFRTPFSGDWSLKLGRRQTANLRGDQNGANIRLVGLHHVPLSTKTTRGYAYDNAPVIFPAGHAPALRLPWSPALAAGGGVRAFERRAAVSTGTSRWTAGGPSSGSAGDASEPADAPSGSDGASPLSARSGGADGRKTSTDGGDRVPGLGSARDPPPAVTRRFHDRAPIPLRRPRTGGPCSAGRVDGAQRRPALRGFAPLTDERATLQPAPIRARSATSNSKRQATPSSSILGPYAWKSPPVRRAASRAEAVIYENATSRAFKRCPAGGVERPETFVTPRSIGSNHLQALGVKPHRAPAGSLAISRHDRVGFTNPVAYLRAFTTRTAPPRRISAHFVDGGPHAGRPASVCLPRRRPQTTTNRQHQGAVVLSTENVPDRQTASTSSPTPRNAMTAVGTAAPDLRDQRGGRFSSSTALFGWLSEYRIDGFRWDSTSNIRGESTGRRGPPCRAGAS